MSRWAGKRVVVIGLARQGKALVRYLVERDATVVLTDLKSAEDLQDEMAELGELIFEYELGAHPLTLLDGAATLFLSALPAFEVFTQGCRGAPERYPG